ncbi:NAD(P)H-hydrate epimerase [Leuconostoc litchii]|uniref:NAD(P)H-hydrate epimerase n=1 Tax=Leuconostoc litchii TaxID=1981069 RepID=A0A6P2CLJ4_9LACO|nr:NAD(P)H-hydrate epimerase [Leuconostoc litchii]TYC46317.1 NAD(P)H-hydrate epimerase [Leuconostoc litchii]
MTQLVTAAEMQQIDKYTIDTIGMPQDVLIERAAMAVLDVIGASRFDLTHVLVLAGLGNNGADGVAIARLLYAQGINVSLQFVGNVNRAKDSVKRQLAIIEKHGLIRSEKSDFNEATLIVDAIFGVGLNNVLPEGLQKMIKAANHIEKPVVAVDIPTGIDATTGEIRGAALKAHTTVSFGFTKVGLTQQKGSSLSGNIIIKDVGMLIPDDFEFSIQKKLPVA